MKQWITMAVVALAAAACGGSSGGGGSTITPPPPTPSGPTASQYVNPVLNADFPDPGVVRGADGVYYAYATQTNGLRIQVAHSTDLVAWSAPAEAMPTKPTWASQSQNFWAPDVELRGAQYVMYFSAQIDAGQRPDPNDGFCIGMATSATPTGPFIDVGHPVVCGPAATVIDPQGFDDPQTGTRYLLWGSGGAPIQMQALAADRATFAAGSSPVTLVSAHNQGYEPLVEGPWLTYRADQGYYYLFYSGNNCCGPVGGLHYAVMVARATSAAGPYTVLRGTDGSATPVLQAAGPWLAPGHNAVVHTSNGDDWMLYHAVSANNPYLNAGSDAVSRRP
ncbi:MAG TPA: glycoside hydrolase family 43 protein, partial [Gemmatirosa sp.]